MIFGGTDFSEPEIDHFVMSITSIQTIIRHTHPADVKSVHAPMEVSMRPTRTTALVFAAMTVAATAASPTPAAAFFFPIGLMLGGPRVMTVNPDRGPTGSTGRVYTVKPGTGTRSRDEDSKPSKASTGTRSRDEDSKPSKASTRTSSKDDDGKGSSKSGKGAKSATKAEANANSGHGGRQTQRRLSVEHEPAASKSSSRANSDTEKANLTSTSSSNTADFDENLGEAKLDD